MAEKPEDAQGINKNPDEEGQPQEQATDQQEPVPSVESLQAEVSQLKEDKKGMESQLIEERRKKQEALAAAGFKKPADKEPEKEDSVDKKVYSVLQKEKEKEVQGNRVKALHKFWESHKEYHPENDFSGIRMNSLNEILAGRFNTANSRTVEDIAKDYEDAYNYMNPKKESETISVSGGASTLPISGRPKVTEGTKLTPGQEKLRQEKGWTVEKYLSMKEKYPKIIP